jgi:hypothetical protein
MGSVTAIPRRAGIRALIGLVLLAVVGCGGGGHSSSQGVTGLKEASAASAGPTLVAGGCGATKLYRGRLPAWTAPAFSDSSAGPPPWPYALSERRTVVAIVFGYPLRAGAPTSPANKVLWIMSLPRQGSPLTIEASPLHANAPLIRVAWPADSSPGEIYPSYVNVPRAGCWRLTLHWARHTDSIDLRYRA